MLESQYKISLTFCSISEKTIYQLAPAPGMVKKLTEKELAQLEESARELDEAGVDL